MRSELRGEVRELRDQNDRVLNAVREDLTDLRQSVDARFAQVENGLAGIRGRLGGAAAGQQQIVELLNTLVDQQGEPHDPGSST